MIILEKCIKGEEEDFHISSIPFWSTTATTYNNLIYVNNLSDYFPSIFKSVYMYMF